MKIKTSNLIGRALDWAVAKCEGYEVDHDFTLAGIFMPGWFVQMGSNYWKPLETYTPSTNWSQGGPIIEQEKIKLDPRKGQWEATIWNEAEMQNPAYGPMILIAAMRCYCCAKLGDEVEVPDQLGKT